MLEGSGGERWGGGGGGVGGGGRRSRVTIIWGTVGGVTWKVGHVGLGGQASEHVRVGR